VNLWKGVSLALGFVAGYYAIKHWHVSGGRVV
jgi:hypothetical protein